MNGFEALFIGGSNHQNLITQAVTILITIIQQFTKSEINI